VRTHLLNQLYRDVRPCPTLLIVREEDERVLPEAA
jgi:hypothetical protein